MSLWCLVISPDNNAHAYNLPLLSTSFTSRVKGIDIKIDPENDENNNINLRKLVTIGVKQTFSIFEREGLVPGGGTATFNFDNFQHHIVGHSADLAFAIAILTHSIKSTTGYPLIAATGKLDEQGKIQSVMGVPAKVQAGLSVIKDKGVIFFPASNIDEITDEIKIAATEQRVELCPVTHLYDVFVKLEIKVTKMCFAQPYLGFQPYGYEHRSIYHGRTPEIIKVRKKLIKRAKNNTPGVMIIAASGAGKSSFVQAGLLPSLVFDEEWLKEEKIKPAVWAVSRPATFGNLSDEAESCTTLVNAWKQKNTEFEKLSDINSWEVLANEIVKIFPENENCHFVWVLDQFEELFFLERFKEYSKQGDLERFFLFLRQLQRNGVWLIATLRNDFFSKYQNFPGLIEVFGDEGLFTLPLINPAMLPTIIKKPAKTADLTFEFNEKKHIYLNEQILHDMDRTNQTLPFLSLTLKRLFDKRENDKLTFQAYKDIGGIDGVIKTHTKETVSNLKTRRGKPVAQSELLDILEKLVGLYANGTNPFRTKLRKESYSEEHQFIVIQLIDARLLTVTKDKKDKNVELALDCLLDEWPEVKSAIKRRKEELQKRQRLIDDAENWNVEGQNKALLIRSYEKVVEAELQLYHEEGFFSPITESYVEKSMLERRKLFRGVWTWFCIMIPLIILIRVLSLGDLDILAATLGSVYFLFFCCAMVLSYQKKTYLLTLRKENIINKILFCITSIAFMVYVFFEWIYRQSETIYPEDILGCLVLFSVPLTIGARCIVGSKVMFSLTKKKDFIQNTKYLPSFFLKEIDITPNAIVILNIIFLIIFTQDKLGNKNTDSILLLSYNSFLNIASDHIKNNNYDKAGFYLEKAEYALNLISPNVYNNSLIEDKIYSLRLRANLTEKKHEYSIVESKFNECIKIGQKFLSKNIGPSQPALLYPDYINHYLHNLKPSKNLSYSRVINQYALCVSAASLNKYDGEEYSKAMSLNHQAIKLFKRAKSITPDYTQYYVNLAAEYISRGDLYLKNDNRISAFEAYNKAEKIFFEVKNMGSGGLPLKKELIHLYRTKASYYKNNSFAQKADTYLTRALTLSQNIYKNDSENLEAFKLIKDIEKNMRELKPIVNLK